VQHRRGDHRLPASIDLKRPAQFVTHLSHKNDQKGSGLVLACEIVFAVRLNYPWTEGFEGAQIR
jgi:hypothetical protein